MPSRGATFSSKETSLSSNWVQDIIDMHDYYGMSEKFEEIRKDPYLLFQLIDFRTKFQNEEHTELGDALEAGLAEEVVDALIDMCVVAIGSLHAYGVDAQKAWDEVLKANMSKRVGIKASRPNPLGLPDLMKPEGWVAPSHEGNHGGIGEALTSHSPCGL